MASGKKTVVRRVKASSDNTSASPQRRKASADKSASVVKPIQPTRKKQATEAAKKVAKPARKPLIIFMAVVAVVMCLALSPWTAAAFVTGGALSAAAGYVGMHVATRANTRTAHAAEESFPRVVRSHRRRYGVRSIREEGRRRGPVGLPTLPPRVIRLLESRESLHPPL